MHYKYNFFFTKLINKNYFKYDFKIFIIKSTNLSLKKYFYKKKLFANSNYI